MQPYTYSVSLRLIHPQADPSTISQQLGLEPKGYWRAGAPRQTPSGTRLEGTYSETYWYASVVVSGDGEVQSLEGCLKQELERLAAHREYFASVCSAGGRVEFYVGVHGPGSYGFAFPPALLQALASLGIALGLEVFPVAQRS